MTWRFALAALVAGVISWVSQAPIGEDLDLRLARRIDFLVREYFGRAPQLSPQIKAFGYDDSTVAAERTSEPTLEDWAKVLGAIADRNPSAIVIDKIFRALPGLSEASPAIAALTATATRVPIYTGAFTHDQRLKFMQPLGDQAFLPGTATFLRTANFASGPDALLERVFFRPGHIVSTDKSKMAPAFFVADKGILPALALRTLPNLEITAAGVAASGRFIPLDRDGFVPINLLDRRSVAANMKSFRVLLDAARSGSELAQINSGDIVFIAPSYFTGNTDVIYSALGSIFGAHMQLAFLNSAVEWRWVRELPSPEVWIIGLAFAGTLVASAASSWVFMSGMVLGLVGIVLGGIATFVLFSTHAPWGFGAISFVMCALGVYAISAQKRFVEGRVLEQAFRGLLPPAAIEAIKRHPERIRNQASEQVLTIMFVDIVGFSTIASIFPPRVVFDELRQLMQKIAREVHAAGGFVDKTLGDGLLAVFGYTQESSGRLNHAAAAVRCAQQVQRLQVDALLANTKAPPMPLRIGINTARVFIGDVGDERRIDFTVIGDGVNFAQRLESACTPFSVAVSEQSLTLANIRPDDPGVQKRFIAVKHQNELFTVFEIDPLVAEPDKSRRALEIYRQYRKLDRKYARWAVEDPSKIKIGSEFGAAELVDFSETGLSVRIGASLAPGVPIALSVQENGRTIPFAVVGEVRWSRPEGTKSLVGVQYRAMTDAAQQELFGALKQALVAAAI
jgi:class 3 adenylate cyclase